MLDFNNNILLLDEIPKGYTDLSTPSAANPKKKNIKIQAPDGKKFSTIKAAHEYFAKSCESAKSEHEKGENEVTTDEKDDSNDEAKAVEITPLESDDDSGINSFYLSSEAPL